MLHFIAKMLVWIAIRLDGTECACDFCTIYQEKFNA